MQSVRNDILKLFPLTSPGRLVSSWPVRLINMKFLLSGFDFPPSGDPDCAPVGIIYYY